MPADLYLESFSPWCEKARWALDRHRVAYRAIEHVPLLGELALRVAARRLAGPVTVPLLVDDGLILMDSLAIAQHAARVGSGPSLFPPGAEEALARWNERSDLVMRAGRAMLLPRVAHSQAALEEQLPGYVPRALRGPLRPLAALGVRFLQNKYSTQAADETTHAQQSREVLELLRAALRGGRPYLLGEALSYADVAMATALQFIAPVDDRYIALGPATRAAFTHPVLSRQYADLTVWRDELYLRHRSSSDGEHRA